MSARKKYVVAARCLGNGCRFLAVAIYEGTCGLPGCRAQVSQFNPILVKSFVEAVAINPKSEVAKDYYTAIMDDFADQQEQAAIDAKEAVAKIIATEKERRNAEMLAKLNAQAVCIFSFSPKPQASLLCLSLPFFVFPAFSCFSLLFQCSELFPHLSFFI